jgi:hypothetical protein
MDELKGGSFPLSNEPTLRDLSVCAAHVLSDAVNQIGISRPFQITVRPGLISWKELPDG